MTMAPTQTAQAIPQAAPTQAPTAGGGANMTPDPTASPTEGAAPAADQAGGAGVVSDEDKQHYADTQKALADHIKSMPDADKNFLQAHLTTEFVKAIGLINGPAVANYLNQFADPNKVLVPVPRQMAEKYMQEVQAQSQGQAPAGAAPAQPQGQPPAAPQQAPAQAPAQAAPQPAAPTQGGGMMAPPA